MQAFRKLIDSMRRSIPLDASFETYYGTLVRYQGTAAPSAAEARRDFAAIRGHIDRVSIY